MLAAQTCVPPAHSPRRGPPRCSQLFLNSSAIARSLRPKLTPSTSQHTHPALSRLVGAHPCQAGPGTPRCTSRTPAAHPLQCRRLRHWPPLARPRCPPRTACSSPDLAVPPGPRVSPLATLPAGNLWNVIPCPLPDSSENASHADRHTRAPSCHSHRRPRTEGIHVPTTAERATSRTCPRGQHRSGRTGAGERRGAVTRGRRADGSGRHECAHPTPKLQRTRCACTDGGGATPGGRDPRGQRGDESVLRSDYGGVSSLAQILCDSQLKRALCVVCEKQKPKPHTVSEAPCSSRN